MIRVPLSGVEFTNLVAGKIVEAEGVEVALSDIGWQEMFQAIHAAFIQRQLDKGNNIHAALAEASAISHEALNFAYEGFLEANNGETKS